MKANIFNIIGLHLALILLALVLIFGCIYIESIDYQQHFQTTVNNKRSLKTFNETIISFPFHINDNTVFCFEIDISSESTIKYVIIHYNHINIDYYLSKSADWNEKKPISQFGVNSMQFNDMDCAIKIESWDQYSVKQHWLMDIELNKIIETQIPIKVVLQKLSVLSQYQHAQSTDDESKEITYFPVEILDDAMTLAALSMLSYSNQVMGVTVTTKTKASKLKIITSYTHTQVNNVPFYGGEIVKVCGINPVFTWTGLDPPNKKKIFVGPLLLYAWKYKDIFVVIFRGTHFRKNWSINFKDKAKQVNFNGISGVIHSGIYDVVHDYINDILKIFDVYNNEKRIIFTGHSLGAGLAQVTLLHLLDVNNKPIIENILYNDKTSGMPSIEYITFAGPVIMDNNLATSLKTELDNFNDKSDKKPNPEYSTLLYAKPNDPVSYSGDDAYNFAWKLTNQFDYTSISIMYVKSKMNSLKKELARDMAIAGLDDIKKYHHFGRLVAVDSSAFNSNAEAIADVASHAEYFDAHQDNLKRDGIKGWV